MTACLCRRGWEMHLFTPVVSVLRSQWEPCCWGGRRDVGISNWSSLPCVTRTESECWRDYCLPQGLVGADWGSDHICPTPKSLPLPVSVLKHCGRQTCIMLGMQWWVICTLAPSKVIPKVLKTGWQPSSATGEPCKDWTGAHGYGWSRMAPPTTP